MNGRQSAFRRWLPSLPIMEWGARYDRGALTGDLLAAVIVTIMLIPQSLAYAMLAGLPPEVGIYASIAPLVAYAVFGSSRVLAVGPVAVVSLMTASAIGQFAQVGSPQYWEAAILLAFLSGVMLLALGLLRLGFFANFLSHPVIASFITASGLIIAASQLKYIMGIKAQGHNLFELLGALVSGATQSNLFTLTIGLLSLLFLFWVRKGLKPFLVRLGLGLRLADVMAKAGPILAIAASSIAVWLGNLDAQGVAIVGAVPQGLPPFTLPGWNPGLWQQLLLPALLISIVGFVESVSVGQTLAAKRRQRIEPDQELVALGASNIASSLTGGFPVTGGFARSVVNFDAGAQTAAAGIFTAVGLLLASLFLTPALYFLPQATLAATIIVAVLSLVDFGVLRFTWSYSRPDFVAAAGTLAGTLALGVEAGLIIGVGISLALYLYRTSKPHIAEVGLVRGTEHFRNVLRHEVAVGESVLSLRIDGNMVFANARYLEDWVNKAVASRPGLQHVVLQCSAVNEIDASALESLEAIQQRLQAAGVALHLSEVKGPVMDQLRKTEFLQHLSGKVFLSHYQAISALSPELFQPA
jgi:SulP family sulfate permease